MTRMLKAMSATNADEDVFKPGKYETQFGKVMIEETGDGYKIVIYVNARRLSKQLARQLALSLIGPHAMRGSTV